MIDDFESLTEMSLPMEGNLIILATQESLEEISIPIEENFSISAAQESLLQCCTQGPEDAQQFNSI